MGAGVVFVSLLPTLPTLHPCASRCCCCAVVVISVWFYLLPIVLFVVLFLCPQYDLAVASRCSTHCGCGWFYVLFWLDPLPLIDWLVGMNVLSAYPSFSSLRLRIAIASLCSTHCDYGFVYLLFGLIHWH